MDDFGSCFASIGMIGIFLLVECVLIINAPPKFHAKVKVVPMVLYDITALTYSNAILFDIPNGSRWRYNMLYILANTACIITTYYVYYRTTFGEK